MACVVFTVDAESTTGSPAIANEEVAEAAAAHPDLIPFAGIDPAKGRTGVRATRRLVEKHQVRGFTFHPNMRAFFPNDCLRGRLILRGRSLSFAARAIPHRPRGHAIRSHPAPGHPGR